MTEEEWDVIKYAKIRSSTTPVESPHSTVVG